MNADKTLWKASRVFAPDFPRQASNSDTIQARRNSRNSFCSSLESARDSEMPGYYSVYAFPRGHSRDGNIPKVNCIFIDFDIVKDDYDPKQGETSYEGWRRDMSALLTRARMVASAIIDEGQEQHFRATLSGHKGLHLYLDFPTIATNNGSFSEFKSGLKSYGETVMDWLQTAAGGVNIDPWVDVDASDLGRLARHPNTIHHGAAYDDRTRWCVPLTIEELSELDVDGYLSLTEGPRSVSGERNPSMTAGDKVVQAIRTAETGTSVSSSRRSSVHNPAAIKAYADESNDDIELEDLAFLTTNKPCVEAFRNRDDAFDYGNSSHLMELNIIGLFVEMGVPRDVIHAFFADLPGYEQSYMDEQIDKIIGREYHKFSCAKIADRAPMFCLGAGCSIYNRSEDIQK